MKKILVVDDEEDIREIIRFNLEKNGYSVVEANSGEDALLKASAEKLDMIILDVMMENMDGIEVCKRVRSNSKTKNIPLIFLSAKSEEIDKVLGLEMGGDDYLTKPFSNRELVSRVKALFRRAQRVSVDEQDMIEVDGLLLDRQSKRVTLDSSNLDLTKTEYGILEYLLTNPGRLFSREQILQRVWDEDVFVIERTVDVHIRRLRKKLGSMAGLIMTRPGMGYGYKI